MRQKEITVYHGTTLTSAEAILKDGIRLDKGDPHTDNGQGFYTTENKAFAEARAKQAAKKELNQLKKKYPNSRWGFRRMMALQKKVKPAVIKLILLIDDPGLSVKKFNGCSEEWQRFIFANRISDKKFAEWEINTFPHNRDQKYDVVIDETADTGVSSLISQAEFYSDGTDLDDYTSQIGIPSTTEWGTQISFHTQKALDTCIKEKELCPLNESSPAKGAYL